MSGQSCLLSYLPTCQPHGPSHGVTNIVAALGQRNRVYQICLRSIPNSLWAVGTRRDVAAMKEPFPALTHLELWSSSHGEDGPALPDSFWADLPHVY